jgi:formate-dependent nitrite reductase membrane component NrfD
VVLSILFLVWDLERPAGFLRVLRRTRRSWLSRGAWILLVFGALAGTNVLLGAPAVLTAVSLAAAVAVAAYTGVLIGTIMARPIWNTPILPVLFLASALSTGIALVGVCETLVPASAAHSRDLATLSRDLAALGASLRTGHLLLLAGELLLLYFYLSIVASRTPDGVALLLRGPLAGPFWVGVVLVGLVLPLGLEALVAPVGHAPLAGTLGALAVLAGGFCLRWVILAAGVRARVYLGVPFVIRPDV